MSSSEEEKISIYFNEMTKIHGSLNHFATLTQKSSKILLGFSKSIAALVRKPIRFGTEVDTVVAMFENNLLTISEIFTRFSRNLGEESQNLKLSSSTLDLSKKSFNDSFKFSGRALIEAKKLLHQSEEILSLSKKQGEKNVCPSLNLGACAWPNSRGSLNMEKKEDGNCDGLLSRQEIYHESEKVYAEKVKNLLDCIGSACKEATSKACLSYQRIKKIYEKGIVNFYEEEKKMILKGNFDLGKEKEMPNKYKIEEYQTPNKIKCQKIDKRDSEVKYESSGMKKSVLNQTPNKENENKKVAFVTFNQKSNEIKGNSSSSEFDMNCRMKFEESFEKAIKREELLLKRSEDLSLKEKSRYSLESQ